MALDKGAIIHRLTPQIQLAIFGYEAVHCVPPKAPCRKPMTYADYLLRSSRGNFISPALALPATPLFYEKKEGEYNTLSPL